MLLKKTNFGLEQCDNFSGATPFELYKCQTVILTFFESNIRAYYRPCVSAFSLGSRISYSHPTVGVIQRGCWLIFQLPDPNCILTVFFHCMLLMGHKKTPNVAAMEVFIINSNNMNL